MSARRKNYGKRNIYINHDMQSRLNQHAGTRLAITRRDPFGQPYKQVVTIPANPVSAARVGIELLLDLADDQATHEKESA